MSDSFRLKNKDGPIKSTFGESIRVLAKTYYPFIYSDGRNISKPIVDLQAAFEVCTESLEEFDRMSTELASYNYAVYGLDQALHRAVTELSVIREEVIDLMSALKTSEKFNLRLLDQLSFLEDSIKSGIDSSKHAMSSNRQTSALIGLAPEHYMIPLATKDALDNIIGAGNITSYSGGSGGSDSLLKNNLAPELVRTRWFNQVQRDLAQRHAEYSFLLISLWSEQVRDNFFLSTKKAKLQPGTTIAGGIVVDNRGKPVVSEDVNLLRMASAAKIDDLSAVIQTIQGRVFEMGGLIFDELNRIKTQLEESRMQHKTLNNELNERRRQLVDSLLATHSAVQTLLDLDERNDALVGKLVKSRPLFADLYRLVQGNAADGKSNNTSATLPDNFGLNQEMQSLAAVLGPQNWKNLIEQLSTLRVRPDTNSS